jgi:hypothetical protein
MLSQLSSDYLDRKTSFATILADLMTLILCTENFNFILWNVDYLIKRSNAF